MNKCIKLQIIPYNNTIEAKEVFKHIRDISYLTRKACNLAMNLQFQEMIRKEEEKRLAGEIRKDKEIYGKSFSAWLENRMNEYMYGCLSNNVAQTRQFVTSKANFNPVKILKGEESLTTFKHGIPVIIYNKAYTVSEELSLNVFEIGLFNLHKQKELNIKRLKFIAVNPDASTKIILNRLMSGEYKYGSAQLQFNKKNKLMFTINYSFESRPIETLKSNRVMGIDLGITKVAALSVYDNITKQYIRTSYRESILDGKELIYFRQKLDARKRSMQIATKCASENKVGHGYKQRTRDANALNDKVACFRDTYNHKVSRYIVDMAIKYKCSVIQLEDLSGFSDAQSESLLKNWSYYDLQQKIVYKASEVDIEVNFINPRYTSKRCSKCGCIHTNNRNCKDNQSRFECIECGHKDNADINASKNIALPNIEQLIDYYIAAK